ncbi:aldose epimerase family protein [Exiguobacterium artemiae]
MITTKEVGYSGEQPIIAFTLMNRSGYSVELLNLGGKITAIRVPDQQGTIENVVLAFDDIEEYLEDPHHLGATIGRVGGRIANGAFALEGMNYILEQNEGDHHLHGGSVNWSNRFFDHEIENETLHLLLTSPDGENGYPGQLDVRLTIDWTDDDALILTYHATTTASTPFSPTNHTYFNLTGNAKTTIEQHRLRMDAPFYIPLNEESVPTGEILSVNETVFDFRTARSLYEVTHASDEALRQAGSGVDHPFLLKEGGEIVLEEPVSGRTLRVETDQPGVVVYTGNHLAGDFTIAGRRATPYLGICLETQGLPDAINQPDFPSVVLRAGEVYEKRTTFQFSRMQ